MSRHFCSRSRFRSRVCLIRTSSTTSLVSAPYLKFGPPTKIRRPSNTAFFLSDDRAHASAQWGARQGVYFEWPDCSKPKLHFAVLWRRVHARDAPDAEAFSKVEKNKTWAERKFVCSLSRGYGDVRTPSSDWFLLKGQWVDLKTGSIEV